MKICLYSFRRVPALRLRGRLPGLGLPGLLLPGLGLPGLLLPGLRLPGLLLPGLRLPGLLLPGLLLPWLGLSGLRLFGWLSCSRALAGAGTVSLASVFPVLITILRLYRFSLSAGSVGAHRLISCLAGCLISCLAGCLISRQAGCLISRLAGCLAGCAGGTGSTGGV